MKIKKTKRVKYRKGGSKTRKKFISLNCNPTNDSLDYTCFKEDDLLKLKKIWNLKHPDDKLTTKCPKKIWSSLKTYYSTICNKESCWVKQLLKNPKMQDELMESFAPKMPYTWNKK